MNHSTPANEDPSQWEMPKTRIPSIPKSHDSSWKSAHANMDIDTHYDIIKDVYVPEEVRRPHMNIKTVFVDQDGDDYIRPNADLEMCPQIRSKEQVKCMYSESLDGKGEFKDFEYHIESDSNKPGVQTPHKVALSVEFRLMKRVRSDWKARQS